MKYMTKLIFSNSSPVFPTWFMNLWNYLFPNFSRCQFNHILNSSIHLTLVLNFQRWPIDLSVYTSIRIILSSFFKVFSTFYYLIGLGVLYLSYFLEFSWNVWFVYFNIRIIIFSFQNKKPIVTGDQVKL